MLAKIKLEQSCAKQVFRITQDNALKTERSIFQIRRRGLSSMDWLGLQEEIAHERARKRRTRGVKPKRVFLLEKVGAHFEDFVVKDRRKPRKRESLELSGAPESGGDFFRVEFGRKMACAGVFGAEMEFNRKSQAIRVFESQCRAIKMQGLFELDENFE